MTMARRYRPREAEPQHDISCEQCGGKGVIGGDVFPYLVSAVPPVHRWMHQGCAEEFRVQHTATLLPEVTADCRRAAPARTGRRSRDGAVQSNMKGSVAHSS